MTCEWLKHGVLVIWRLEPLFAYPFCGTVKSGPKERGSIKLIIIVVMMITIITILMCIVVSKHITCVYKYIYIYIYTHVYICIYLYLSLSIHIYIYIYTHIHIILMGVPRNAGRKWQLCWSCFTLSSLHVQTKQQQIIIT